jgi:alkanesulfonate monooxygenase SsuD/methylene tetrahydromethanopterin reductase-like flavin-dependent oxidoreductase (luciferase family)
MRFGIDITPFGELAEPSVLIELAVAAEAAGWDGVFLWDHLQGAPGWNVPIADAWVSLAAIAARTERIRLGPLVLALPRRRPWLVARAAAALDRLSGGRLILGAGMGYPPDAEFTAFDEDGSVSGRAARLDEGLEIVTRLWTGEPVTHAGAHWQLTEVTVLPVPVQQPRIPIWIGARWPGTAGLARAARWDGIAPMKTDAQQMPVPFQPEELAGLVADLRARRGEGASEPFDVVVWGETGADRAADADRVASLAGSGATWWCEPIHGWRGELDTLLGRVRQGPPRG